MSAEQKRPAWLDGRDCPTLKDPKFEDASKVHDWRNHVPDELVENWDMLTASEQAILHHLAEAAAKAEQWD